MIQGGLEEGGVSDRDASAPDASLGARWYVVQTKPHQEGIAERSLQRLGFETFSPQLKQSKPYRGSRRSVIGPLFPGYLFVRFNIDLHFRAVNFAQGTLKVVAFGAAPARVDDDTIDALKARLYDGFVDAPSSLFSPGQTVTIQEGPLRGLEAVFEREMSDRQRAILLLQALSYQARVVVELESVAPR